MNLYHIQFDRQPYYVEAESLAAAALAWRRHVAALWDDEYAGIEEPESIARIHDEAVIR